jgi:hypothetical protein
MIRENCPEPRNFGLEAETRRRVLAKHLAWTDITAQNATGAMPCGSRDGALGRSVQRSLRRHPGAKAVACDVVAFMPALNAAVLKMAAIESRCRPVDDTWP